MNIPSPFLVDGLPYLEILPVSSVIHCHFQIMLGIPAELVPGSQSEIALALLVDPAVLRITVMVLPHIVEEILPDDAEEIPFVNCHFSVTVLPQRMSVTAQFIGYRDAQHGIHVAVSVGTVLVPQGIRNFLRDPLVLLGNSQPAHVGGQQNDGYAGVEDLVVKCCSDEIVRIFRKIVPVVFPIVVVELRLVKNLHYYVHVIT